MNAKFVGSHGGISIGEDGPSQMAIEDYALMCALPGFVVMSPSDEFCARALVQRMAEHVGPIYAYGASESRQKSTYSKGAGNVGCAGRGKDETCSDGIRRYSRHVCGVCGPR